MRNGERITIKGRDYRLDAVLSSGAGSYGQVWAATDAAGRAVAIKFINAEAMTQADPTLHGHWRAHLEREIAFLAGLNADQSRHVVVLLAHGVVNGQPALVLERLQANLDLWLAQQRREGAPPPDLTQVLDWAGQILDGLDVVHQAGFVYRDLKFSNLLVGEDGARLKLADFGSLKREDGDNTRSFIGTPATMAPEQVLPARQGAEGCEYAVDYRADYYALGLLLFALLTDQPTTAAQRRLGQLLALYGQEGAGQHGAQLGGLDDEERELLRRSVEFWTVPVRPEQGGGGAALLVGLIDRLLARDPADRPAHSREIRAALVAARSDAPTAQTLTPDWRALPPVVEPPNRHPRQPERPAWPSRRRWALLASGLGLAGAVAWAIVRPVGEIGPDRAESLSALIAPPAANLAKPPEPAAPAVELVPPAGSSPTVSETAPPLEPVTPLSPADAAAVTAAPAAPPPTDAPAAEVSEAPAAEVSEAPAAEVSEAPAPAAIVNAPGVETPAAAEATPPVRLAPTPSRPATEPPPKPRPPAVVATPRPTAKPAAVAARPPARAKSAGAVKSSKPAAASAVVADRPPPAERSSVNPRRVPVSPPALTEPSPSAPASPARIAKPVPPPAAPETPRRASPTVGAAPAPRGDDAPNPVARARQTATTAARSPTPSRPPAQPARPIARIEPSSRVARRSEPAPALPPIKLEARPTSAPALPPIKLEARAQSAPPAPPPIELVSRSRAAPATLRPAPAPPAAPASSKPRPRPNSSLPPADPVTQFRDETGRALTAFSDAVGHAGSKIGREVQRGLETADRTVGQWTGHCNQADGCSRNMTQVERRDPGANRSGHTLSQRPSRMSDADRGLDEDEEFVRPPPRQSRDDQ